MSEDALVDAIRAALVAVRTRSRMGNSEQHGDDVVMVGKLLRAARQTVPPDEWGDWVKANCGLSPTSWWSTR